MDLFSVIISKKEKVTIDKNVFIKLLDIPYVQELAAYQNAILNNEIKLDVLKNLSKRSETPYPLFFAPLSVAIFQRKDNERGLNMKIPSDKEISLNSRGKMKQGDIELIAKDIERKQIFLKKYNIVDNKTKNEFIGLINKYYRNKYTLEKIAEQIRAYFEIDLLEFRKYTKPKAFEYLRNKIESKNIFISKSSYNYMPQKISREIELSAFGVKDKIIPFIFLNNRDGDDKPLIIESEGRQIFTLILMTVCIGLDIYILSTKKDTTKDKNDKLINSITAEILIPKIELSQLTIDNIDQIKEKANNFNVTPMMLLTTFFENKIITLKEYKIYNEILNSERIKNNKQIFNAPTPTTGFRKYNGERFSREIVKAFNNRIISKNEFKNITFRKGNIPEDIFRNYINTFK